MFHIFIELAMICFSLHDSGVFLSQTQMRQTVINDAQRKHKNKPSSWKGNMSHYSVCRMVDFRWNGMMEWLSVPTGGKEEQL